MKYSVEMIEELPINSVLRVEVTQDGVGINGPLLELRSGAWLGDFNKPQAALAGQKDPQGEPGVAEFVNVKRGAHLLGVEVQVNKIVHIPLEMLFKGLYVVKVDLTAPWEPNTDSSTEPAARGTD